MLIEQMLMNLNLASQGPGRLCTPKTGYFYDKTKISKANR